jgi:lipopolysaccharide transport system ATP-binding protein
MSAVAANNNGGAPAVQADGLGKHYDLGELRSLPYFARRMIGAAPPGPRPSIEALSGVDFSVNRGDCFGMVGGNGCGKSTLLQILSGITLPSSGSMVVRGRVLPLLAVGTGFHPELTGSENVLLFGTTLGVPRRVILERIDQVAEFAELELHMDTPTKRFSVGMLSRLCFATAVLFPADIYLFDEVLAVVDAEFQVRCLREIKRISAAGGTVIFVSHDLEQVADVCNRVMWLENGSVRQIGTANDVLAAYRRETAAA